MPKNIFRKGRSKTVSLQKKDQSFKIILDKKTND